MSSLLQDLKLAFRSLRAAPLTAAAAILVIAIGTGANTAVFAVTYGILMRPLPYLDVSRLVILSVATPDGGDFGVELAEVEEWRRRLSTAEGLAGYAAAELPVRGAGEPRLVRTAVVTANFFEVLGAPPVRGQLQTFAGPEGAAVFSERLEAVALGQGVTLGDRAVTAAALMPASFGFPSDETLAWKVAEPSPAGEVPSRFSAEPTYRMVARLRPGVSLEQARDDAVRVMNEVRGPQLSQPKVTPVEEALTGGLRPVFGASLAAAQLVLLVTCGNVAMLLLGRALARRRESAVRLALGAGRWQLVRLPLAESLLLAVAGSLLGVGLAYAGVRVFVQAAAGVVPRSHAIEMDLPVLAASAAMVLVITLLCGIAPALQVARKDFMAAFRGGDRMTSGGRVLAGLVVGQVAVAIVLLTGAALLVRTVGQLLAQDTGVEPERALVVKLPLGAPRAAGASSPDRAAFVAGVLERVRALPGVQAAGMGTSLPPKGLPFQIFVRSFSGDAGPAGGTEDSLRMSVVSVTSGFLDALGARPLSGRLFTPADERFEEPAVILSESAARFAGSFSDKEEEVVERELAFVLPPIAPFEGPPSVAGVVRDVKYAGLDVPADAAVYLPLDVRRVSTVYLAVRTAGEPAVLEAVAPAVRRILREADPTLPVGEIRSLEDEMASSILDRRLRLVPALGFAAVALAVALTGVFAMLSRAVAQRRRELAVRIALGASEGRIMGLVLRRAALLTGAGLVVGLAGAVALTRGLGSLLFGVGPRDPLTFTVAAVIVAAAALLAAYVPARRAARVEPLELLRTE